MRAEWALHVIPCVAMLYLMRKAGKPTPSASSSSSQSPSLPTPAASDAETSQKRGGIIDERTGFAGGVVEEGRGAGAQRNDGIYLQRGPQAASSNIYASYGSGGGGGSGSPA